MNPAAVLTLLVKTQGATAAAAQLTELNTVAARTSGHLDKASDSTKKHSKLLGGLGSAAKSAGVLIGAAGFAGALGDAVSEYREAQKVGAQTNAVLKSTHGAANITRKGVENLANAISRKSGIDDEQIQASENMLLTFTKVRNEVGKGNDIFNQATQTVTDMSVALGQSGKSSAIQLGKALNDPIKGVTALRRVGVQFTKSQQDQIKTLENTGHHLDAQKLILRELTKEFGGSAAAQATAGDKLRVALGNLAEAAGRILVPAIDKVATVITDVVNQMLEGRGIGGFLVSVFKTLAAAVVAVVTPMVGFVKAFRDGHTWAVLLGTAIAGLTAGFVAYKVITLAIRGATIAWAAAQAILNVALTANPIALVVVAIAGLVAAFVVAYKKSETFRNIIDTLWGVLKDVFGWIKDNWPLLLAIITGPFGLAVYEIVKHAGAIKDAVVGAFKALVGAVKGLAGTIAGLGKSVVTWIVGGIKNAASFLVGLAGWWYNRHKDAFLAVKDAITALGGSVVNWIVQGVHAAAAVVVAVGGWVYNRLKEGLQAVTDGVRGLGGSVLGWLVQGVHAAEDTAIAVGGWVYNRLKDGLQSIKNGFLGLGGSIIGWIVDGLKGTANKLVDFLNDIIGIINKIPGVEIGKIKGFSAKASDAGGDSQAFARGGAFARTAGLVDKPMVMMGEEAPRYPEFVIPTNPAYRKRAQGLLAQASGAIGFAQGGILGDFPSPSGLGWLEGTGKYVIGKVATWVKDKLGGMLGDVFQGGTFPGLAQLQRIVKGVQQANRMDAMQTPYLYGGGHNPSFSGPWDCSGAVSAVLHAMGLLGSPVTTDALKVFGESGDGRYVTIGVRGSTGRNAHTMMKIGSRYFESGGGHGAKWVGGWDGAFPIHRHPPGFAQGGVLGRGLLDPRSPLFLGWGLRQGGVMPPFGGSYANGGVVPGPAGAARTIIAHGGERVGNGATVHIEHATFASPADAYLMADRLAWKLSIS